MLIVLLLLSSVYSDIRIDIDTAISNSIRNLSIDSKTYNTNRNSLKYCTSNNCSSSSYIAKTVSDLYTADKIYENINDYIESNKDLSPKEKNALDTKKNYLYRAIIHAQTIVDGKDSPINVNKLSSANDKIKIQDIKFSRKEREELEKLLQFNTIDSNDFENRILAIASSCSHLKNEEEKFKVCVSSFLASEIKDAPKDLDYQAFLNSCCSSAELDSIQKQHRLARIGAFASSSSSILLGDYSIVSGLLYSGTNELTTKLGLGSFYLSEANPFDNFDNLNINDYQNDIYANNKLNFDLNNYAGTYRSYASSYNPQFFDFRNENNNIRNTSDNLNISTSTSKTFNETADKLKTKRGGTGSDTNLGGDLNSDETAFIDLTPEDNFRLLSSGTLKELENLSVNNSNSLYKHSDKLIECMLAAPIRQVRCRKEAAEINASILVNNMKIQNLRYQLEEYNNLYANSYYSFNLKDVLIEALNFKTLFAGSTKDTKKSLNILQLEKPFSFKTSELKPDWQKKLARIIKDFETKANLAKKEANKHKKELRKLLKIKEKEISVAELSKVSNVLKDINSINKLEKNIILNQKKLSNVIRYNKKLGKDKLERAKELNNSYTKLLNTSNDAKVVLSDAFFLNKNLFNEAISNIAYRDYASSLLEE